MSRKRQYESAAARQAAYRDRVYWQQAPTQKFLAGMAQGLHQDLLTALQQGNSPLPAQLLGEHAGETLNNLRDYVRYGSMEAAKKARCLPD
jgi:hypothetical protein